MGKVMKGIVLGGAIGAGYTGYQALSSDEPADVVGGKVARAAGTGAVVGGFIGIVLNRRAKKKQAKKRLTIASALSAGGLVEAARAARPAIEHAAEVARERASQAAEAARPRVEHAVEVARPHVEHAAEVAREKASQAAEAAKPRVEQAAVEARKRSRKAADRAREALPLAS
jgi:hypothetical protein